MNHAVLITAHRDPLLLAELIDTMSTSRTHVFVHIDRDAPFTPTDVTSTIRTTGRVTMVEPRQSVHWRGYSFLALVLRLLRLAHATDSFDFYHLLSGQCFPTEAPEAVLDAFEADPDREYLECFPLPTDRWTRGGLNRMWYHHLYDRFDARRRFLGVPFEQGIIYCLVGIERVLRVRRPLPGRFEQYYGGSVFWSLTGTGVDLVLGYLDEHPGLESGFENTYCPEEILFATVIGNSARADRIALSPRRYIDWTFRNGSIPANLDESDLPRILGSDALFVRKVDPAVSAGLLDELRRRTGTGKDSGPP